MPAQAARTPPTFSSPWPVVGPGVAAESTAPPTGSSPARGSASPVVVTLGDLTRIPIDFDDRYPHRQPIHRADARLLEQVPVKVRRDLDARVAELLADVFDALSLINKDAGIGVSKRMETDRPEFGAFDSRAKNAVHTSCRHRSACRCQS
jgi:hypothetical protein